MVLVVLRVVGCRDFENPCDDGKGECRPEDVERLTHGHCSSIQNFYENSPRQKKRAGRYCATLVSHRPQERSRSGRLGWLMLNSSEALQTKCRPCLLKNGAKKHAARANCRRANLLTRE